MYYNLNKTNISIIMYPYINNVQRKEPFLPPISENYQYTLVLDIDETLVHFFPKNDIVNGMFLVRPYCLEFLKNLNQIYEIVTFSEKEKDYVDNILNILDINNNFIKYRLYFEHNSFFLNGMVKDLNKLGRDLKKVIIVDNNKNNFIMQQDNGILLKPWKYDINDTQLMDLMKILNDIVELNVEDVTKVIKKINHEINMNRPLKKIDIKKMWIFE